MPYVTGCEQAVGEECATQVIARVSGDGLVDPRAVDHSGAPFADRLDIEHETVCEDGGAVAVAVSGADRVGKTRMTPSPVTVGGLPFDRSVR